MAPEEKTSASPAWQGETPVDEAVLMVQGAETGDRGADVDGPFGAAVAPGVKNALVRNVPSLTSSSIEGPSDLVLVAEAARWEMGLGLGREPLPITPTTPICFVAAAPGPYAGERVRVGPRASSTGGEAERSGDRCGRGNPLTGTSTFVAVDGSARRLPLRDGIWKLNPAKTSLGVATYDAVHLKAHRRTPRP